MQRAGEVVLADLGVVERPAVVFALPDMHPLSADRHTDVHPVAWEPSRLRGALADPADQGGHLVPGQEGFQALDFAVLHRALWQDDYVDGAGPVSGCGKCPVREI